MNHDKNTWNEEFLYYIWQYRLWKGDLHTVEGLPIEVVCTGIRNHEAGADFLQAQVRIGNTLWAGNVEMHVQSSDWKTHKHHTNKSYSNVILHVVLQHNKPAVTHRGENIFTVEIAEYIPKDLFERYAKLLKHDTRIPCEGLITHGTIQNKMWIERLVVERLTNKSQYIETLLQQTQNSWEEVLYLLLAHYFGGKTNGDTFEELAKRTPLSIVAKIKPERFRIEALYFGQAGFLTEHPFQDDYPNALAAEYAYLKKTYGLHPLKNLQWNFAKLRPYSFPTVRISQWASLLHHSSKLFSHLTQCPSIDQLKKQLACEASPYWQEHFRFDVPTKNKTIETGKDFVHNLLVNVVLPLVFVYGKKQNQDHFCHYALYCLSELPPEKNKIISKWKQANMEIASAFESQALTELHNRYCEARQCLQCLYGHRIFNPDHLVEKP